MYKWILPEVVQSKFLTYFIRNRQESWTCLFKNLEISKLLEKERERERDRQTDRQTDRQRELLLHPLPSCTVTPLKGM